MIRRVSPGMLGAAVTEACEAGAGVIARGVLGRHLGGGADWLRKRAKTARAADASAAEGVA